MLARLASGPAPLSRAWLTVREALLATLALASVLTGVRVVACASAVQVVPVGRVWASEALAWAVSVIAVPVTPTNRVAPWRGRRWPRRRAPDRRRRAGFRPRSRPAPAPPLNPQLAVALQRREQGLAQAEYQRRRDRRRRVARRRRRGCRGNGWSSGNRLSCFSRRTPRRSQQQEPR